MSSRRPISKLVGTAAAMSAAAAAYALVLRPRHLRWGATEAETLRPLPGDDLVPAPRVNATHAVTIQARSSNIWPWLAQIGQGRGGFYSYTWIERMIGADIENTDRILPEHQELKAGDTIPFFKGVGPPVALIEPGRYLVLGGKIDAQSEGPFALKGAGPEAYMAFSWLFYLEPAGENTTRLIERFRLDWNQSWQNAVYMHGFLEPGAFVMERKMLLGIKQRAEDTEESM